MQRHNKVLSQVCKLNQSSSSLSESAGASLTFALITCVVQAGGAQESREGLIRTAEQLSGELGCQGDTNLESDFSAKAPHLTLSGIFKVIFSKHTIRKSPLERAGLSF